MRQISCMPRISLFHNSRFNVIIYQGTQSPNIGSYVKPDLYKSIKNQFEQS